MSFETSTYKGDETYSFNCTGDAVVGDEVRFERATFSGSFRKPKFAGFELITGKIIRDSYGDSKQQHTFTLRLADGSETRIKGRNLYANGCYRKPWDNEKARDETADEKHSRGNVARELRRQRIEENY